MVLDGRTPVIVGVGQVLQRLDAGQGREPVDLLVDAFRVAETDTGGSGALVPGADSIRVVEVLSWAYRDPARLVGERLGATPGHTVYTGSGGHLPQVLVGRAALDIQAGRADVVLVGGAETWRSRTRVRAGGGHRSWARQPGDVEPTELIDPDARFDARAGGAAFSHRAELAAGVVLPVQHFPLIECALRVAAGRTPADHERWVAGWWSRFSAVATANPYAWSRRPYSADELLATGPDNRMVALPYRKRWCSNNQVDMAAGLIVCSADRATAAGVPRDRWVFPLAGAAADDPLVSERTDLARSPAIGAAGRRALTRAGIDVDEVAHIDVYSCFPAAVQLAACELGLRADDNRSLTVTGGLAFAGGPWSNYVTHALATMTGRLRSNPGTVGLVTGLGGFATKHAVALYGTDPPAHPFRWEHVAPGPSTPRPVADRYQGLAHLEAWTVMFDPGGAPETGIATCITPAGHRAWATTTAPADLRTMATVDLAGAGVELTDGQLRL